MIKIEGKTRKYWDKNGVELKVGDVVRYPSGELKALYLYEDENGTGLGTDATNPAWIESGRACECEYGIYPLTKAETEEVVKA